MTGTWDSTLAEDACKVVYTMRYAFSSRTLDRGRPIFNRIAYFIDSFTQRAQVM